MRYKKLIAPGTLVCAVLATGVSLRSSVRAAATINELYLPQYVIKGSTLPLQTAAYLQVTGLTANATYRYFTGATTNAAFGNTVTPGGYFGITPGGTDGLIDGYTSSKSLGGVLLANNETASTTRYSTFTADASGAYTGWFSVVPDASSPPFTTGNSVYFYLQINTPGGNTITQSFHTADTLTVLAPATNGANSATAVAGFGGAAVGNERMVLLYDNVAGTGRPLWGTWTEDDGISPVSGFNTWYNTTIGGTSGAWGAYLPNDLPNGLRRVEYRDENGNLLSAVTSPDGKWSASDLSGTVDTANLSGGSSPVLLSASPQAPAALNWSNAANTAAWNTTDLNWSSGAATVTFNNAAQHQVLFPEGLAATVIIVGTVTPGSTSVTNQSGTYHFSGGAIGGSGGLTKSGAGILELASANTYSGGTTVSGGKLIALAQNAIPSGTPLTITSGRAEIASRAATDGNAKTLVLSTLTLSGDGVLDLNDNDLLIQTASDTQIRQWIVNGQGVASAPKITSTWAAAHAGKTLGYMTAADYSTLFHAGTFNGQTVSSNSVIVAYTLLGDATLDGKITLDDYAQLQAAFLYGNFDGTSRIASWVNGDFNYDGLTNYLDYAALDAAYAANNPLAAGDLITRHTTQFGPAYVSAVAAYSAQVPEPATAALIALGAPLLYCRSRHRKR